MTPHTCRPPRRARTALVAALVLASGLLAVGGHRPAVAAPSPHLRWTQSLPGTTIRGSSPLAVDLDGGGLDVVVGSHNSWVYGFHGTNGSGVGGWPFKTTNKVDSSPSAADVTGDGSPEVFVGTGYADTTTPQGAAYGISAGGGQLWRYVGADHVHSQQAVQATLPIGDVNNDGNADVTFGTIALTSHSLRAATGQLNPGWPFMADDSTFSSGALADVNGDGQTDILVGGDSTPGSHVDHKGGLLRAMNGNGTIIWQRFFNDIVYSSPAVGDLDGNGTLEVAVGNGDYWQRVEGPAGHEDSRRVFLLNAHNGNVIWSRTLAGLTTGSPALADVNGDGRRDVVIGTQTHGAGRVYAFDTNGNTLLDFAAPGGAVIGSVTTADVNSDGRQDVVVPTGGGIYVHDGRNGHQLFGLNQGVAAYQNSVLATDVDGNGLVDLVAAGTKPDGTGLVQRWEISESRLGANGWHTFRGDARRTGSLTNPPLRHSLCTQPGGYWMVASDGGVFSFCDARFHGSTGAIRLNQPIVGMASTRSGNGYWLVARDGGIFAFGDAQFHGSTGAIRLNQPIVGMARTGTGNGYWLVAADGGIFAFGDAQFYGSTGAIRLNQPIVGMAALPNGRGYWLVARDGGIFAFGDARFHGSTGATRLNQPIVGMSTDATGNGYWLVAADGGIFAFNVPFRGSTGAIRLNQPIVGISRTPGGDGYRMVALDGGIFAFNAAFFGSMGGTRLNAPIVGMAAPGI